MSLALLDCPTGLAGNMILAALLDGGVPEAVIHEPLAALGLAGAYRLEIREQRSAGLRGLHLAVLGLEPDPPHRTWASLREWLGQAPWPPALCTRVLAVFGALAEAEAAVHGHAPEAVHFHEVGALDALVDVVGVCAGLLHLGVEHLWCTPPPAGHGSVSTAHGVLPVPVPAVLELARRHGIPLASSAGFPAAELTTPTGLALAAVWSERFAVPPAHRPLRVGVGLGSRPLDRPNLLRLVLADPLEPAAAAGGDTAQDPWEPQLETVVEQQAQIDDATPEDLAAFQDSLRQAGALEVFCQPILMKKGRPGWLVTTLAVPESAARLRGVWWTHSTTLGVRERSQPRWVLPRRHRILATPLGPVPLKQARLPDGRWRSKPEHDALRELARSHNLSMDQVRAVVHDSLRGDAAGEASAEP